MAEGPAKACHQLGELPCRIEPHMVHSHSRCSFGHSIGEMHQAASAMAKHTCTASLPNHGTVLAKASRACVPRLQGSYLPADLAEHVCVCRSMLRKREKHYISSSHIGLIRRLTPIRARISHSHPNVRLVIP